MRKGNEVLIWHVALNPDGTLQDIVAAYIPFGDVDVLRLLLQTKRPAVKSVDFDEHTGYLFAYDNNRTRPYPSVIIFRYNRSAEASTVVDMGQEDLRAVAYACENLLK